MRRALAALAVLASLAGGCKKKAEWEEGLKVAHLIVRSRVGSLDPVRAATQYDNITQSQIYEPLLTFKYLVRPYELEPLLLEKMPEVSEDGRIYTFDLKQGLRFQDDACFPGGEGREVVARDFFYSLRRMADRDLNPEGWWLYQDRIVGFDAFQKRMNEREPGAPFDWDAEIAGFRELDRHRFQVELTKPFPQFLYVLTMTYTAIMPRECAEHYGSEFASHPVGTGPFVLESWSRGNRLVMRKNPNYRQDTYPSEASEEAQKLGLTAAAGQKVPFLDAIVWHVFEQDQPMWLKFRVGDIHLAQVPAEYQEVLFEDDLTLRERFARDGIRNHNLPLLDFIYRGFNMEDPVVGVGDKAKYLRQAISLALDGNEINDAFYNGTNVLYDGPISPGLEGYKPGVLSPYRGPDLARAKELLAKAGYPEGRGLPALQYEIDNSGATAEQAEMFTRQLGKIGIRLEVGLNSFPELKDKLNRKKAQMFSLAWGADYPDAENFLQLFYGPNEAPGSNNFNYKNPEYDDLYEQASVMLPSPERTVLYEKMRDLLIEDVPAFGSMARIRFYVWHDELRNVFPSETWYGWYKYLDLDDES